MGDAGNCYVLCEVSASSIGVDEESSLLECDDMHTDKELPAFRINVLLPSSESGNPRRMNNITSKFT